MPRTVVVVVEARASMGAVAGIVTAPLRGEPALDLLLRRLVGIDALLDARIVVATSSLAADDAVASIADARGISVVRGTDGDPLDIVATAAVVHEGDEVALVRATGPLGDPYVVAAAVALARSEGADLTTNRLPRSYPAGLEVDVLSRRALHAAALEAVDSLDRARAGRYLARRPSRFRLANLDSGHDAASERWTLQDRSDLRALDDLLAQVPDPVATSWNRILATTGRRHRPRPGELVLRPQPSAPPGSNPWVRRWDAVVDGATVGTVAVERTDKGSTRLVEVPERHREVATAAIYRWLLDDDQAAP